MGGFVDLHLHTCFSDGSDTPEDVVRRAVAEGLEAIAITDHDCTAQNAPARAAAESAGIEYLAGTEVSAAFKRKELHILGLGIDPGNPALSDALDRMRAERASRAEKIVAKLNARGSAIELDSLLERAEGASIGRMHIAQELVRLGEVSTVQGAFDKYIKAGRPAYVAKANLDAAEAVDVIHAAGGLAFVAHPGLGDQQQRLAQLCEDVPFDGIEVFHSRHTGKQRAAFAEFAAERGMLITGGSDCHGSAKGQPPLLGKAKVPREVYDRLREALQS